MNWPVAVTEQSLEHAARLLQGGGVVAFPTETYYGLAVDPFNQQALEHLFRVKRRPHQMPLLVLVGGMIDIPRLAQPLPVLYDWLIRSFWPGPLTLVCQAQPWLPPQLTGDTGTIGIRQSPHSVATGLVAAFRGPVTATSANLTGFPAASTASDVARMFGGEIDLILDGGPTPGGCGSTLVVLQNGELSCIRPGKIPFTVVQKCAAEWKSPENDIAGE